MTIADQTHHQTAHPPSSSAPSTATTAAPSTSCPVSGPSPQTSSKPASATRPSTPGTLVETSLRWALVLLSEATSARRGATFRSRSSRWRSNSSAGLGSSTVLCFALVVIPGLLHWLLPCVCMRWLLNVLGFYATMSYEACIDLPKE
jgi:hypothetical protein